MQVWQHSLLLALGVALGMCSCSATSETERPGAPSGITRLLPPVATLDSLGGKGASAVVDDIKDVNDVVAAEFSMGSSAGWVFQNQPFHSWVLYRLPAPAGGAPPLAIRVLGSSRLWMVVGDFATGRWVRPQQLGPTLTQYDLTALGDPVSPANFIYVAFVLTQSTGGLDDRISLLGLRYDNETNPPVFYVASPADGGNDSNTGSKASPWATLQHAADNVMPGDTVVVLPGDYVGFHLQTGGLAAQPISFLAQPGVRIVDSNMNATNGNGHTNDGINLENWDSPPAIAYVNIEGFTIDADLWPDDDDLPGPDNRPRCGIRIVGSADSGFAQHINIRNNICRNHQKWGILTGHCNDILIEGNECSGSKDEHGIYHSNSGDRATIRGNYLYHNHGCGIHMNGDASAGGDGIISDCLIEGNIIFENAKPNEQSPVIGGGSGINCDGVQNSHIFNNLLFDNHASGISLYMIDAAAPAINNKLSNNTVVVAADGRWALNIRDGSTGATVRNNILVNRHSFRGAISVGADSLTAFISESNIVTDRFTLTDGDSILSLAAWRTATGQDSASVVAEPAAVFYNAQGQLPEDYQLRSGSPARDAGGLTNAPPKDLRGVARPQGGPGKFDAGCFEME